MSDGELIRTALYDEHVALGGNIVDFHGFELPIWYSNIKAEHLATRESAGLFDVSHMGTFRFTGENVSQWLESVATQKVTNIPVGRCAYTHFLDDNGFIIDDMIKYAFHSFISALQRLHWSSPRRRDLPRVCGRRVMHSINSVC